jgi:Flp pilus assembly secretin CpaC
MGRRLQFAVSVGLLLLPMVFGTPLSAAEPVQVAVDQATLIKLPEKVGTIIVGNPLIADVVVQAGGTVIITGKGYGATNLVALDRQGNVLMERLVQVGGPRDATVVVYRGIQRETYSCAPDCERRITLGDTQDYFIGNMTQTSARNMQAQGSIAQQPR